MSSASRGICFHIHDRSNSPGTTLRVYRLAESLRKKGVDLKVVSPFVSNGGEHGVLHSKSRVYKLIRSFLSSRFGARVFLSEFALQKVIRQLTKQFADEVAKSDPVFIQAEQEIAALACLEVSERFKVPLVVSLHNIWGEELVAANIIQRQSKQFRTTSLIVERIVNNCDLIIAVSDEMAEYLVSNFGVARSRVVVIPPNGVILDIGANRAIANDSVVYAGLMAHREHVDLLIKSMAIIKHLREQASLHMTDKGELKNHISRLARSLGVEPTFFWFERQEEFFRFLSTRSVGALPSSNDIPRRLGPPLKMLDYMSAGVPIVANDIGGWSEMVSKHNLGVLTEDDPRSFADGIESLLFDPEKARLMGENGMKLVHEKLNWDNSAAILSERYRKL